ncbi:ligase-associated DNA damage response endonuclease PdeM [Aquabacterium sp.]|uniref:ligase-associated DNA damage response endonuclease PdeM n=1 Tax=Aquabacterium sp. TaxID=1872578 RepID=UPI002CD79B31|nr:ligase-associated DNA damage response endonuclease PdeM [Aquabacterium sp.]HSW03055.1 ligase-associated DNA damage response endonuclease PdeM [Aquabacterium sp.]
MNPLTAELAPGAALQLWPQRAAFDAALGMLLIADAHLGKAQSFRRLGVPVPAGTTAEALARLDGLIAATGARHIVFLGDLLHSERALAPGTLAAFRAWRARHAAVTMTLVRGNHDERAGDPPADLQIAAVDGPLRLGPWALQHHPAPVAGAYALAGHVHPCVVLGGRAKDQLRLPCFHFGAQVGVLPAFGGFTGMHALPRQPGDRLFAVADTVVEVPPRKSSSAS